MNREFRQTLIKYVIALILIFFCTLPVKAQLASGAQFLRMNIGSEAQGMGNAYTAVALSANGMHHNPAGMGFGINRELMLFHSQWFQDISVENITFMYPFTTRWSLGTSLSFLHMPELTRYEVDPTTGGPIETGTFRVYNMVATTGIGFRISDNVSMGTNVKFFQEQLENVTASGVAFDVGLLTRIPNTGLRLGAAVQHIGPPVKYIEKSETLPLTYKAGMALKLPGSNSTIAVDVAKTEGEELQILPGIEWGLSDNFFMRGGYQFDQLSEADGFTAGFGLQLMDNHKINYVYVPYGDLGDTHRAEVVFHLGSPSSGKSTYEMANNNTTPNRRARDIINTRGKRRSTTTERPRTTERQPAASSAPATRNGAETEVLQSIVLHGVKPAAPGALQLTALDNDKMKLTWQPVADGNATYHIYAKPASGAKWIRITPQPISKNYQVFTKTRSGVNLMFVVTTLLGDQESDFSNAASMNESDSFSSRLEQVSSNASNTAASQSSSSTLVNQRRPETPTGVNIAELNGNRIKLTWDASIAPNIGYHIYAKANGSNKWIKITHEPIKENYRVFTKRRENVNLVFVVTAVNNIDESDFSRPAYLNMN